MNRRRVIDVLGGIVIVGLICFFIYNCNKPVAKTAPVAAVAPTAQAAPVAQTAPVANDCQKTAMEVVNLTVTGKITTPEIVVEKKIVTPKIKVKEKITTPKIRVKEEITTPKIVADKVETKLFVVDKTTTKLFVVDKMTVKEAEIEFVKKSKSAVAPALKCDSKDCWPKNPTGNYFGIGKIGDAVLVGNVNNSQYSSDSISAKLEYHSGTWGSRVVVRNITTSPENLLSSGLRQEIANHLAKVSPYKVGQSGKEGESCFEKTWIVNPATKTWSIRSK